MENFATRDTQFKFGQLLSGIKPIGDWVKKTTMTEYYFLIDKSGSIGNNYTQMVQGIEKFI